VQSDEGNVSLREAQATKKNLKETRGILEKIYPTDEMEKEMKALQLSVEDEKQAEEPMKYGIFKKIRNAWGNKVVRRGLYAGITVQVAQQFVRINTVLYYSPTIAQLAGYASNKTALALSLITAGLNALGTIISMLFVDKSVGICPLYKSICPEIIRA
ncbi:inositol transporter 4, partial [Tanacetum coccineum]